MTATIAPTDEVEEPARSEEACDITRLKKVVKVSTIPEDDREHPSFKSQASTESKDESLQVEQEQTVANDGQPPIQSSPSEFPNGPHILLTISIYLSVFLIALDKTILATAVPQITQDFHSLNDIGWYASAFLIPSACTQLPFGKIYTFWSPKNIFLICIGIFEVGSLVCGLAKSSTVFIVGRAIAGLGSAGIQIGGLPLYQGGLGVVLGVAAVAGPILGGALTSLVSWRWYVCRLS